jgi:hypothetical protein
MLRDETYGSVEDLAKANRIHPKVIRQRFDWPFFVPTLHPLF